MKTKTTKTRPQEKKAHGLWFAGRLFFDWQVEDSRVMVSLQS